MLQIRQACLEERDVISHLGKSLYRAHFQHLWYQPLEMEQFLEQDFSTEALNNSLACPDQLWLLASLAGEDIGFAKLNWNRPLPDTVREGAELQKIYLRPGLTGQRLGEQLFNYILDLSTAQRQPRLWLEVLKINPRACTFYQRLGFTIAGETQLQTASQAVELWVMEKQLGESGELN